MRLAVVGSRSIREYDLAPLIPDGVTEIISGGAAGVDKLAERYAGDHNLNSSGTMYTVNIARKLGKPVYLYRLPSEELEGQASLW